MKKCFFIVLLMLLYSSIFAINGVVYDAKTGAGIWRCKVRHDLTGNITHTDREGKFRIKTEGKGGKIFFSISQYVSRVVNLEKQEAYQVKVTLVPQKPITVGKVIVKSKRQGVSKKRLSSNQIKKTTTSLFADTYKVVQMLPGVVTGDDFSSLMYIRGGNFYEAISLLDDMILINPYVWGGNNSIFNPNLVDSIDFYSGGFPSVFGQALSGILNVSILNGNPTNTTGFIELSATTFEGLLEGPLNSDKKSSYIVGIRRTHYDQTLGPVTMDVDEGTTFPFFYDGQAKFNIALSKKTFLNINTLVSYEGMNWKFNTGDAIVESAGSTEMTNSSFHYRDLRIMQSLRIRSSLSKKLSMRATIGFSYRNGDYHFMDEDQPMDIDQEQKDLQTRADLNYKVTDNLALSIGAFGMMIWNTMDLSMTSKQLLTQTNTTNAVYHETNIAFSQKNEAWIYSSAYFSTEIKPFSWLKMYAGGRFGYFNINKEVLFSPRFAIHTELNKKTRIKAATGIFKQYPFYVANGVALSENGGNPDLKAETAYHYVLSFERDLGNDVMFRLEGFYKCYNNIVVADPDPNLNYRNSGERKSYGFDIFLQKKPGGFIDGWLTYSYIKVEERIRERNDPILYGKPDYKEPLNTWFTPIHDRRHNLSLVVNLNFSKSYKIAITYRYSTGTPYTPLAQADPYHDIVRNKTVYKPIWGSFNSGKMPDYHRLDIKAAMPFFGIKRMSSFIQIINMLNSKNVTGYYYTTDFSERKEQSMLPFMFIGGIKFQF